MTEERKDAIIGIDLGTTMSAAAVYRDGQVVFIENALGETLSPSVVAFDERSSGMVVGRTAKDILAVSADAGAALFKRDMGEPAMRRIRGRDYSPVELSAYVLDALRSDAERMLGQTVDRCVITVPAYFSEPQRQATKQAAEVAGFAVERMINEPTAAAIAYGLHQGEEEREFVVLDLGGGTFDVCVMERFEGLLEVKSVAGASQLGGEDFTRALYDLGLSTAGVTEASLDARARMVLLRRAELLKRKLTRWPQADLEVPTGTADEGRRVNITQADAERAFQPLLDRMVGPCRSALRGADLEPGQLTEVILVGGATRMPCIAALAEQMFDAPVRVHGEPDHVVVMGAAIQAALCARDEAVSELVVTDVASHTLGIAVSRDVLGHRADGYFSPIIDRNTVIPVSRSERFGTIHASQTHIELEVYEGEARKVSDNRKLGELQVSDIPPGPPRDVIDVRFTFDMNGLLEVEVTVLDTGHKSSKIFQRGEQRFEGLELAHAVEKLARLKADPKERPRYRDLLARAGALWSEVQGAEREALSAAIDMLEAALSERRQELIEPAFDRLSRICQTIDQGERW